MPSPSLQFRLDDLTGEAIRALIVRHVAEAHANTPAKSVHALGIEQLRAPGIRVWSAWIAGQSGDELAGCGALKRIDDARAEIKSMRIADERRGQGLGRAILDHLIAEARASGCASVWLETGATPDFVPARALYVSAGFVPCGPFADYREDPLSAYMTRGI